MASATPSIRDWSPALEGEIDYGSVFQTFTEHTEQKRSHGIILRALLLELKRRDALFNAAEGGIVVSLVDLGCGEGHTACEMIEAIVDVQPRDDGGEGVLNYYGLDGNDAFVLCTRRLLSQPGVAKHIRHIDVRRADVLSGERLPFQQPIDHVLVTMGHVLYYAYSSSGRDAIKQRIGAVVDSVVGLLRKDSMALFVHSAAACPLAALRASVANSEVARPSVFIAEIARERGLGLVSFVAPYQIHFPHLSPQQWEDCKDPRRYHLPQNRDDPRFAVMLELLMFIAQRSLIGLAREGRIGAFVDALRAQLDAREVFEGMSDYQIVFPSEAVRSEVEAAVRQVENELRRDFST